MLRKTYLFGWRYIGHNVLALVHVLFFALLCLFLFSLGFANTMQLSPDVQAMIVLVCIFFTGQRLLDDFHTQCRYDQILPGILLSGCRPPTLFLGLTLAIASWLWLICAAVLITLHVIFPALPWASSFVMLSTLGIGCLAYASLGVLCYGFLTFGGVAAPMVFTLYFPLLVPVFLLMHRNLICALSPSLTHSLGALAGITLLFVFLSALLYEWVSENIV